MLNNMTLRELIWAKLEASGQFRRKNLTDKNNLVNTTEILVAAIADSVVEHIWSNLEVYQFSGTHTHGFSGEGSVLPGGDHVHPPTFFK